MSITKQNPVQQLFDLLGRKLETLVDGGQLAGEHRVTWNARDLASGIYFYQLTAYPGNGARPFRKAGKLLLAK